MDALDTCNLEENSFLLPVEDVDLMDSLCPELEVEEIDESILNDIDLNLECDDDGKSYSLPKSKTAQTILICDVNIEISPPEKVNARERPGSGFQCNICTKKFSMESRFCRHMSDTHHIDRPFQCKWCSYSSACTKLMIKHCKRKHQFTDSDSVKYFLKADFSQIQKNKNEEILEKCNLISDNLASGILDSNTIESVEKTNSDSVVKINEQVYFCCRCPYQTITKSLLNAHVTANHAPDQRKYCDQCSFTCKQKRTLDIHIRKHKPDESFKCEICSKIFYSKTAIKRHLITHSDDRPYACTYDNCMQSFKFQGALTDHVKKVHLRKTTSKSTESKESNGNNSSSTNVKSLENKSKLKEGKKHKFRCPWKDCNRSFRDNYNLNIHIAVHTGKKKLNCPHCTFTCIQKTSLHWHLSKKHNNIQ